MTRVRERVSLTPPPAQRRPAAGAVANAEVDDASLPHAARRVVVSRLPSRGRAPAARAFSLVELIVVIGVIVLIAGGIGLALGDSGGNALATAQTTLAGAVNLARSQAAVSQTETIVAIHATRPPTGDADRYLRYIQVFRSTTPGTAFAQATWEPVGPPVALPRGVFVVPPSTAGMIAQGVTWPTNPAPVSTLRGPTAIPGQVAGTAFGSGVTAYIIDFNPDGTITQVGTQAFARLAVATATLSNNLPLLNNAGAVRGLLLRPTGGITFVNSATGF